MVARRERRVRRNCARRYLAVARKPKLPAERVSSVRRPPRQAALSLAIQGPLGISAGASRPTREQGPAHPVAGREGLPRPINCAAPGSVDDTLAKLLPLGTFLKAGADRQARVRGILERFRDKYGANQVAEFEWDMSRKSCSRRRQAPRGQAQVGGPVAALQPAQGAQALLQVRDQARADQRKPGRARRGREAGQGRLPYLDRGGDRAVPRAHAARHQGAAMGRDRPVDVAAPGDAHRFGPQHMKGERIQYTQAKGGKTLWLPAAPQLLAAIKAMPSIGFTTYLVTDFGKPFSKAGIGNKMREWCDEAGLPHCTTHGLRKAAARRAGRPRRDEPDAEGRRRLVEQDAGGRRPTLPPTPTRRGSRPRS
jgi:hypothetical protein